GSGQRREEADHDGVRDRRRGHGLARGPGGDAVPSDRGPDRPPPHAQARPPQPARPAAAGRPPPPAAELPRGHRHHPLPLVDRAAGPAPV
ncbi:MAG: SSU ribosomal protein S15p (S13e), partial [uncultured Corynebacteriales bacterium]